MSPKDNNKQVSAAVRILQQKRDASARATHLMVKNDPLITYEKAFGNQAAVKKFFIATFLERKKMSTKTSIKRIALVAASALAIGGFSVISAPQASAATTASIALSGSGAVGSTTAVTAGLTYTAKALSGAYFPTVTITAGSSDTAYLISSTGVGSMYGVATPGANGGNVTYNNNTSTSAGFAWHKGAAVSTGTSFVDTNTVAFAVTSATAGDQVITLVPVAETNKPLTLTITWGAAAVVTTASTSFISTTLTDSATADVSSIQVPRTAGTQQAVISVTTNSATATTINGTGLKATISGPGTLGIWSGASFPAANNAAYTTAATGRDISISATTAASDSKYLVTVWGDGTSGVSTITLTAGTTVIGTETVTFYGSLATLKATVKKNVANTGAATTGAIDVIGYDSANVVVPSVGLTITSGTTATIASYTSTSSTAAQVAAATAVVDVTGISGKFGSVVLTIADTSTKLITTTATVVVGATEAATVAAAFDNTSYNAGDLVTLTLTALDKNGVGVADSTGAAGSLAITTNGAVQGTIPTASAFKLGKQVITFYAPLVAATLQANIKLVAGAEWATALDDTTIVATATVEGDSTAALALDAANAATDAANNAYDEAQNATQAASDALAAVTALAAQVKSLIESVKKLTAAVAKLKK